MERGLPLKRPTEANPFTSARHECRYLGGGSECLNFDAVGIIIQAGRMDGYVTVEGLSVARVLKSRNRCDACVPTLTFYFCNETGHIVRVHRHFCRDCNEAKLVARAHLMYAGPDVYAIEVWDSS